MIKNYLKTGFRSLLRNKSFTFLNVLGLSVGIASSILLFVVIRYESSFDNFHAKKDRIYRIVKETKGTNGNTDFTPGNALPTLAALQTDIPQFEKIVPVNGTLNPQITVMGRDSGNISNEKKFLEEQVGLVTNSSFFDVFDFPWMTGSPKVLDEPNIIVLSRTFADKYFGDWKQAEGQYLKLNNKIILKVGGVLKDIPLNTDFPIDIVVSYETKRRNESLLMFGFGRFDSWETVSSNDQLFVLLPEHAQKEKFDVLLSGFGEKHYPKNGREKVTAFLSPLEDQHFDARFENYSGRRINRAVLVTLSLIAGLIIVMACINFINLATAQSVSRSMEVGVRKALGGVRRQLIGQFMTETGMIVFISTLVGVLLTALSIPLLSKISQVPGQLPILGDAGIWLFAVLLMLGVSFLAGFYPSVILSGFQPIEALKNRISSKTIGGISLRKLLIVAQFAVSQVLIIGTIVTLSQMNFISQMDLGFSKEGVYVIPLDPEYEGRFQTFRNELLTKAGIEAVSFSSDQPSSDNNWSSNFSFDNRGEDADFNIYLKFGDDQYFETYGLEFIAGQPYGRSDTSQAYVVNETLLRKLGVDDPEKALGKNIRLGSRWKPISGVVKDFKSNSAREDVKPIAITSVRPYYFQVAVKLRSQNLNNAVEMIRRQYDAVFPEVVFTGSFFDDNIENFYLQDKQMSMLYQVFAGLAIFIACLGLFGMAAFTARQRTKEIGIRKVLGASVLNLSALLSADFVKLVVAAILIAGPAAYFIMNHWLRDFQDRISLSWWMFAAALGVTVLIALFTVSFQALKAALKNPVRSLRSE